MNRAQRLRLAQETVAIAGDGRYTTPGGVVDIREGIERSVAGTRLIRPGDWDSVVRAARSTEERSSPASVEVTGETTLAAARRLVERENCPRVLALNFASAKNPGGGFLNGSQAQEESLARASALYATLQTAGEYYHRNRASHSLLYTDHAIYSPDVPVFRDDDGRLLERPYPVSFVTMPAPNRGAMGENRSDVTRVEETLARRINDVLAIAVAESHETLVLGAWGCGVFRNDPAAVARLFHAALFGPDRWAWRLGHVVFAVLDRTADRGTIGAFETALASEGKTPAPAGG